MRNKIENIKKIKDRQEKSMYFVAVLTEMLEKQGVRPILVGGGALEFYTQGSYMTRDIDLVVDGREQAKAVLEEMGFRRGPGEKSWYSEELDLSVEIPDYYLAGSMDKITAVDMGDGLTAYLIGIEDLVIDRLNAFKHWDSLSDGEWAFTVKKENKLTKRYRARLLTYYGDGFLFQGFSGFQHQVDDTVETLVGLQV